jgi:hypothetical protein
VNVNEKRKGDVIVAVVAHSDVARAVLVPTFTNNTSPLAKNTIYSSTTTTVNNNVIAAAGPTATTSKVQVLLIDKNIVSYDKPSNLGFFGRNTTKTFVEYKFLLCASWGVHHPFRARYSNLKSVFATLAKSAPAGAPWPFKEALEFGTLAGNVAILDVVRSWF